MRAGTGFDVIPETMIMFFLSVRHKCERVNYIYVCVCVSLFLSFYLSLPLSVFCLGADSEQEGGPEQGDFQMWLQGQHQT